MFKLSLKPSIISVSTALVVGWATVPYAAAQSAELMPPSLIKQNIGPVSEASTITQSIGDILTLEKLEAMMIAADLEDTVDEGTYTVFAPRDSAFWQVPNDEYTALMSDAAYARDVTLSHIFEGDLSSDALLEEIRSSQSRSVQRESLNGKVMTFEFDGEYLRLTDEMGNTSEVTRRDLGQVNGRIHIINGVMAIGDDKSSNGFS